jgi:hypothetical protein
MTSNQLTRYNKLHASIDEARRAGNIAEMQRLLAGTTSLLRSCYGMISLAG